MQKFPVLRLMSLIEAEQAPTIQEGVATHYNRASQHIAMSIQELQSFLKYTYPKLRQDHYKGNDLKDMVRITNGMLGELVKARKALKDVADIFEKHYEPRGEVAMQEPPPIPQTTKQASEKQKKTSDVEEAPVVTEEYKLSVVRDVISGLVRMEQGKKEATEVVTKTAETYAFTGNKKEDIQGLFIATMRNPS